MHIREKSRAFATASDTPWGGGDDTALMEPPAPCTPPTTPGHKPTSHPWHFQEWGGRDGTHVAAGAGSALKDTEGITVV